MLALSLSLSFPAFSVCYLVSFPALRQLSDVSEESAWPQPSNTFLHYICLSHKMEEIA